MYRVQAMLENRRVYYLSCIKTADINYNNFITGSV